MAHEPTRRRVLGAGASIGLGMIAGCSDTSEPTETRVTSGTEELDEQSDTKTGVESSTEEATETSTADTAGLLPVEYVVTKEDEEIRAYDGDTLRIEFSGTAGTDDGRILQETFDATQGGRVFIRRGEYTPDRRLNVDTSYMQVHSDFARLTFQDHPEEPGQSQIDFMIGCADDRTVHVELDGLVLDANKANRTTKTRTADICNASGVTLRNCIILGGKSTDSGGGYGIGEDDDTDFITIDNCVVRDSDRHAYHPSADHHRIVNSTFLNNAKTTGTVFDLKGTHAVVANNLIERNGHGVILDATDKPQSDGRVVITGNVFVDNYLRDIASGQIEFTDAAADSVLITDNTFVLPSIDAQETSAHVLFDTDNQVGTLHLRNNHFEGGGPQALTWFTESGRHLDTLVVEHNTFNEVPRDIGLLATAERLLLRDNLFECTGSSAGQLKVKECGSGVVSGNVTYDGTIDVESGQDIVVEGNHRF